jgi:hypothetical protein
MKDSGEGSSNSVRLKGFNLQSTPAEPSKQGDELRSDEPEVSTSGARPAQAGVRLKFAETVKPTPTPSRVQAPAIATQVGTSEVETREPEARGPDTRQAATSPRINAGFQAEFAEPPKVESTASSPVSQSVRPGTGVYTPDSDPERVRRRQWWKHDLYTRSGRQRADQQAGDRGGGAARSQ